MNAFYNASNTYLLDMCYVLHQCFNTQAVKKVTHGSWANNMQKRSWHRCFHDKCCYSPCSSLETKIKNSQKVIKYMDHVHNMFRKVCCVRKKNKWSWFYNNVVSVLLGDNKNTELHVGTERTWILHVNSSDSKWLMGFSNDRRKKRSASKAHCQNRAFKYCLTVRTQMKSLILRLRMQRMTAHKKHETTLSVH